MMTVRVWMMKDVRDDGTTTTSFTLTHQACRDRRHLVSLLIPDDCIERTRILTNTEVHRNAGVAESNIYVCTNTKQLGPCKTM